MDILKFEWDPNKAKANIEKHGISFQRAVLFALFQPEELLNRSKTIYRNQSGMVNNMREEYDIKSLNPPKNHMLRR